MDDVSYKHVTVPNLSFLKAYQNKKKNKNNNELTRPALNFIHC